MQWLSRVWRRLKILYLFLLPMRFSIIALAVAAFAFVVSDQGQDIIRAVGETDPATGTASWGVVTLFLLFLNLLAYQIWFWARQMLRLEPPASADDAYFGRRPNPDDEEHRGWALGLPRILGALLFVVMFYAFWKVRCSYGSDIKTINWLILILIAVSFVVFLVFVVLRRRWLGRHGRSTIQHIPLRALAPETKTLLAICIACEIVFFIATTAWPTKFMGFGAGDLLLLTLSLWVPLGSALVYGGIRMRVPILTFLLIWAFLISPVADWNHVVRTVPTPLAKRPTAEEKLIQWHQRVSASYPPNTQIPLFIVATEGGGIRAAYWTATVLDSLQDSIPLFRRNLFAISSVSGGSLGATVFTALLTENRRPQSLHQSGSMILGNDFLTPTLASMTQDDLVQRFLPLKFPDRERALERAWEDGFGTPTFARGMVDLFSKHDDLPSIFINGTMVETGDRIITSNCTIRPATSPQVTPPPADLPQTTSAQNGSPKESPLLVFRNAYDGIALLGSDIPMSATAGMSARFTYVSPAGRVPSKSIIGHVVDGGYFENSGAVTAAELVQLVNVVSRRQGWNIVPIVILIDYEDCSPNRSNCSAEGDTSKLRKDCAFDAYGPFPTFGTDGPEKPRSVETWANEVLSPVRALLNTRGARGEQAVGDVRTAQQFEPDECPGEIHTTQQSVPQPPPTVIEFRLVQKSIPIPLGWVLSRQAANAIDSAITSNGNRWSRDAIAGWLSTAATEDRTAARAKQQLNNVMVKP